ncbi:MAG: carboxymuconolactone decarboxylase family protein [Zoogloeaceae bacterium]|uniref:carboxymuconolactone decarboxylase family protein n=1 Tax=Denitromonas sp. TaxID=2734609 RepID=UPI001D68939F|nr:carboxymuconolactone decarboxylase family protein [Rhodocyclaceae bacterium]MCP5221980.1 carboxymuconolactone decarboxylase family protein [Zoogloeaceae bacterium]HPR07182.1 carboxymuconolactone decarboxylase family protein [Denitromonas sp.]
MPQIAPLTLDTADTATAATLKAVKTKLGMVPNMFATLAQAPAALNGYLGLSETLGTGRLSAAQREIVALAAGQANRCQYCLSAHTLIGKGAGLSEGAIAAARKGKGDNALDEAIAGFARALVEQRGVVSTEAIAAYRSAGLDDGLILEVIANVALNTLTNYTNHVADTAVDFPVVAV